MEVCDPETNYTKLELLWASKSNCKQRRGRVLVSRCLFCSSNDNRVKNTSIEEIIPEHR
jgi:hypothetical protein